MSNKVHISLDVKDVDRSVRFYEAFFGQPAHKRRSGYANFDLDNPALKLGLNQSPPAGRGSLNHLGIVLETRDEVEAARKRLTESKLVSFDEGDTVCCYARQDKVWVQDPDGNKWEVYVLLDDMNTEEHERQADADRKQFEECCASGCCEESRETCCA